MAKQRSTPSGQNGRPGARAGQGRRRTSPRTTHKPRKLAIEPLESRTLLSADVGLRYAFDLNGTPVTSLSVGNTYVLNAYIRDNRGAQATGVLQAYFDVNYSSNLVSILSGQGVTAGPQYDWAPGGNVPTAGEILGAGGESTFRVPPSPTDEEQLLFSVPIVANSAGTLTLSTLVDTSSGNTIITMFPYSTPPTISAMSDVEVDGLNGTTLSSDGSTVTGTISITAANAGVATHFVLSAPAGATAGKPVTVTVTAEDVYGNVCPGYTGTVQFSSTDAAAALPASSTLTNGVGTFSVTFETVGNQTLTATDAANNIVGSSAVTVSPSTATHFVVSAPTAATAGTPVTLTVTAKDAANNTATGYTGTVQFTCSDPNAVLPANATLTNGTGTFSVTLKTAGSQTVTATDTGNSSLAGSSGTINVSAAAATHFAVSTPASATAGAAFTLTITAMDAYNNTAIGYGGTVQFTSSDAAAVLPANATLSGGVGTFNATLKTAGSRTVTVTDISNSSITGTSAAVNVNAAVATHFTVSAPASATAGSAFNVTVTALDAYNNTATGYGGTVHFTSSDAAAVLPANSTLTAGAGTFSVTLKTAGSRTITATDASNSSITGISGAANVSPAAATHLVVASSGSAVAGTPMTFTVTAQDAYSNTATSYAGTVHFTSSDTAAALPANSSLAAGTGSFTVTFKTSGSQTLTATDTSTSSITGGSAVTVSPAAATHFVVSAPATTTAGTAVTVTVTALDVYNNIATGYAGTVHFTSTDSLAILPANATLTGGVGLFSATLETAGSRTLTATDTSNGSLTGSSGAVSVSPAAATRFTVSAASSVAAGSALTVTVTAKDAYNNTVTGYGGTVHITSSDAAAVLPANSTLTSGTGTFSVTLKTAGSQTVTATDTSNNSLTGSSGTVTVAPGAATHFVVTAPATDAAGGSFSFTVVAEDAYNNKATGYAGTVSFTSTDPQATLPANASLPGGQTTFSATLKTAGSQTIVATDTSNSSLTGSGTVVVSAGAATHLVVSAPAAATAGAAVTVTVTAEDTYNNTATGYTGTVHFISSDTAAILPANATLSGGTGTFGVTLKMAGSQTVTAADTVTGSIAGVSGSVNVSAAAATHFILSAPASSVAGSNVSFTVTAIDAYNNTATGYAGTVHFTSSDPQAVLPANATLTSGTGTFNARLKTVGNQTLTAADTVNGSVVGSSGAVSVSAAAVAKLVVSAPANATAGTAIAFTVTAQDSYGNTVTSYADTVHFSSSDAAAVLPANAALTGGTGTFSATLKTAGSQTLTATDTSNSSLTGSSTVLVGTTAATHFVVSAPASATAGSAIMFTVTAESASNTTVTGYAGTVQFSSSDPAAVLPANATLTNGTGTFTVTLKTAGSQTITATDTANSSLTGSSSAVSVSAAAATHFVVIAPASSTAGSAVTITVTAQDAYNNKATGYAGTVRFTSSDTAAALPANSTLTNGAGTFSVTLKTAGSQTITVTDTNNSLLTGNSGAVNVSAAAATHFVVGAPASAGAGSAISMTVTAEDAYNNTVTGYAGTVHFTSSDAAAAVPANSTLTNGAGTFSVTLKTAGSQTITATDTANSLLTGSSSAVTVSAAAATHFVVVAPAGSTAGSAVNVTVTAQDAYGNTAAAYAGTVYFTSSDAAAVLPANAALTSGTGTFSVTLKTAGSQSITATDTANSSLAGSSGAVNVNPAAASHFVIGAPAGATASIAFTFTVTAEDAYNNTVTGYAGTVHFTSSDSAAVLPANSTLINGAGAFSVTLKTGGSQTISATDTANSSLSGSSTVSVSVSSATHFTVTAPAGATAGSAITVTVTAKDVNNNTVAGYTGTVHFSSSDPAAVLPANATLTNGVGTFSITLKTAGSQTITATDTTNSSLTGSTSAVGISPAAAAHFAVSTPASAAAGSAFSLTVTAQDAYNNTVAGYTGTVHFTSSDAAAALPANATLTNGVGTFSVTLKTAGSQTITASDTVNSSLAGSSGAVTVSPTAATHFAVSAPASDVAGNAINFTVTAQDAYNNTVAGYSGTVHFTSSDAAASVPANATLTNGVGTFSIMLKTAGSQTITATDTTNSSLTGSTSAVSVSPAAATHFEISAPASVVTVQSGPVQASIQGPVSLLKTGSGTATLYGPNSYSGGTYVEGGKLVVVNPSGLPNGASLFVGSTTVFGPLTAPASVTAGTAFTFAVVAQDAFNNTVTGYSGTLQFSSSDPAASLPATTTLTNGIGTFSATLKTAGSQTITATDTSSSSLTGSSGPVTVSPAAVTHLAVNVPAAATAGSHFSFTVTAEDAYNNAVSGYAGTVRFTSSDPTAALPANTVLTGGTGTFNATLDTAGSQTITATDTSNVSLTGSSAVTMNAAAATHFVVTGPASATAGNAVVFTLTAQDAYGNTAAGYAGTVHVTSTDPAATLPSNFVLTSGTATFSAAFQTAGSQTLTATDTVSSSITGSSAVNVTLPATHFVISAPSTATAGGAINIQVTAENVTNTTAAGYSGTVHFTSTDSAAVLPANATLTNGVGTFSVTLNTAGSQTVTATDTLNAALTGSSSPVSVTASSGATHFVVIASRSATAGKSFSFTVTAESANGNTATGYTGTVQFSSSDPAAVLPANAKLINGTATFTVTLKTAGSQTITATDTANSSLTGASGAVSVTAAAASQFVVAAPATAVSGSAFTFTVTAEDPYNNPATSYSGSVHFSSSDSAASLPGNKTLVGGTGTFTATLNTAGSQTLTVTDTSTGSLTGTSTVNVSSGMGPVGPATRFAPVAIAGDESDGPASPAMTAAPSVIMQTPPSTVTGNVMISYDLISANQDMCSIQVQFSPDGGITWQNATAAPGGDGTQNLPSGIAPPGYAHEYMWASSVDIGNVYNADVEIRITPVDSVTGESGAASSTASFVVNNTLLPDLVISGAPSSIAAGTPFNFVVTLKNQSGTIISSSDPLSFYSSDAGAVLPSNSSLAGGVGSFSATLNTEGQQWIAVDDATTGAAAMVNIDVLAAATQLGFTTSPQSLTAGTASGTITIALENASGIPVNAMSPVTVNLSTTSAAGTFTPASPLTIPVGASTVSFQYLDTASGTPTLTASASGLTSATQQETVVALAANHAVFTTAPQIMTAGGASGTITIALRDTYGNPADAASSLPVSLATTSPKGTFTPSSPLSIAAGASTVSFQYTDTAAGAPTLTATAGSFASITQQETVSPAAASHLVITTAPQTLAAGVESGTITAVLEDAFGNPVVASSPVTVNLSTTSARGTFTPSSPLTIAVGASTVSFQYKDTAAGTPTLTVAASGLASATQQEAVNPAAAGQLAFTTAPQTLTAGAASGTITVALEDAFGNPVNAGSALTVSVSTTSGKGTFTPASPLTIAAGAGTVSFQYKDMVAGTPTLTAAAGSLVSAAQQETINPATASQLAFTTSPQTLTAGVASGTITVALEDAFGNLVSASGAIAVTLSTTSGKGTFAPASSLTIAAGATSASFQYADLSEGTSTLTAAASGLTPATQGESVIPAAASHLAFTTPPQTLTAGVASGTITVALEDAFGNPVTVGSALTVNVSTSSGKGTFTPSGAPGLTIAAGASTVSFQYKDTSSGTPTLTASSAGLVSATQHETVDPAAASQLAFITAPQTLTAGVASGTIMLALEDAFGNPIGASGPLLVSLSTTSGNGAFSPASPLTIPTGAGTVSFQYQDTSAGTPTLTAAASGVVSATQRETVVPAAASQLEFTTAQQILTAGTPSQTMTVDLADAYGNPVDASGNLALSLTTTSVAGQFVDNLGNVLPYPAPLTIVAGASAVSFQYADTTAGMPTLTATAAGFAPAAQQETVVAAAASQLDFITPAQVLTAGTPSQTMTVELDDAFGNPVAAGSALAVSLSTTSAAGTFAPLSTLAIPAGASTISFHYTDTAAGAPTLTATTASVAPTTQQETVVAAAANQLAFITSAQTLTAGTPSQTMTVELEDAFGNPASAGSALSVSLNTTSAKGTFAPLSPLTILAGDDTASFQYTDTLAGTPALTAAAAGLVSARQVETVNPAAASHLVFTTSPQTLTAGVASGTITITLEDASGNVADASSALTVKLTSTSGAGTFSPAASLTISSGGSSASFHYTDTSAGTPTISAAVSGFAAATQQETVVPAATDQLVFTTAPETLTAGVVSGTMTVGLEDAFGNPVNAASALTVNLSTTSGKGTFTPPGAPGLTIPAGSGTVSFQYDDTAVGTPTITAAITGIASVTQRETVNPAAASQLAFTTSPQRLIAGVESGTITVALEDAFGNPVAASSALTVNLSTTSGKGAFTPPGTPGLTIPAGSGTVSFQYTDSVAGTPTIMAAVGGLGSAAQQETVIPAAASQLAFTTAPQTLTAGVASGTITVALEDSFGNPIDASSALTVNVATTSSKGAFTPVSPLTIPAGSGTVSFDYKDTAAGTPTITASAGGLASAAQQETVNPAATSQIAFTTAPQTLTAGVASGTITVALEDAFGNPVDTASALAVNLSTTSGGGTFAPASPLTIPAGAGSVSFQYSDSSAGTPTLTAAAGSLPAATQKETVNPAAASHLAFTTAPRTLTVGVASGTITVALEDSLGNRVDAGSPLTVSLSTTSGKGTFTPESPLTIAAGASTVSFTYTDPSAGTPTITVAANGIASATQQETIIPAAASHLAFTASPQTLTAGVPSGTITVVLEDSLGNPVDAGSALTVSLGTTSAAGTFTPVSPLTIPAGASTVSFQYSDTLAGKPVLTASAAGLASATQQETVDSAAASRLAFTTAPQTLTAGVASGTITLALEDSFGNPIEPSSALTVSLGTTSAAGSFAPLSPLTISTGSSTVSFRYTDRLAGSPVLTATTGNLSSATQQETVRPAAASHLAFTTAPQTLTAGTASGTITLALEDSFGNPIEPTSALTVSLSTTSAAGSFAPPAPLTIPVGSSTVSFHYTDTSAGTPVLTAAAGSLASATQQEAVTTAAASRLAFTTAPQTLTAGIASGTITVALEDAFGNHVDAGSDVTLTLSSTSTKGTFTPSSPLTIPAGASTVSFQYTDTSAGTPTLTAAAGVASATQQETVKPAAASHLAFATAPQTLTAGVASGTITVALEDSLGNAVNASSALTVTLGSTATSGAFLPVSPLTIPAGSSSVSFHYTDNVAGTPTLTAAAGSFASATQQETVVPAAASRLAFTTFPQLLTAGIASGTITAALEDAFGNAVETSTSLTVSLSTTSSSGTFTPVSPLTIPTGADTVNFQYTDSSAGAPTITASASGVASATQQESVNPAAATHFAFTTAPQTLTAGVTSGTITVALEDAFGNPVANDNVITVSLITSSSTGTFTPGSPQTILGGSNSVSFHYTDDAAGAPDITVAVYNNESPGIAPAQQQETVNPAAASQLAFTTARQTLTAGVASGAITVALEDSFGNQVEPTSPLTVNLSTTSGKGTFAPDSPLTIPAGVGSVSFQYTDDSAGTPKLTARDRQPGRGQPTGIYHFAANPDDRRRLGHDDHWRGRRVWQSGRGNRCLDGQSGYDFRYGHVHASVALDHSRRQQHRQLQIHGHYGGRARALGLGGRPFDGHAAGNRQRGASHPVGVHHHASGVDRRHRVGHAYRRAGRCLRGASRRHGSRDGDLDLDFRRRHV
jgi:hypothetical protein